MKLAVLAILATSAAAFTPASTTQRQSTSLSADWRETSPFKDDLGVTAPLGLWDPLGCLESGKQETLDSFRYIEIKHGRVAMLAVVGYLTTAAGVRLPGDIDYHGTSFESIPSGVAALSAIPKAGIAQMLFMFVLLEMCMRDATGTNAFVGDFRNDFIDFGWDKFDDATKTRKRTIELNNGRAAMMGIVGLVTHEQLGNLDAILPL